MQVSIVDGTLRRDEAGRLQVLVKTRAPFGNLQEVIEGLRLDVLDFGSDVPEFSTDPDSPTVLTYRCEAQEFPFGFDATTLQVQTLTEPMDATVVARARAVLQGDRLAGAFEADILLAFRGMRFPTVEQRGSFELRFVCKRCPAGVLAYRAALCESGDG